MITDILCWINNNRILRIYHHHSYYHDNHNHQYYYQYKMVYFETTSYPIYKVQLVRNLEHQTDDEYDFDVFE